MLLSEEERSRIGQKIQNDYIDALRKANVLADVLQLPGSLGGIENCLHHPDHDEAKRLVQERIATARNSAVSDDTIHAVLVISLKTYEAGCQQGLYDKQQFDVNELLEAHRDSG